MARKKTQRDPFEVKLSDVKRNELELFLRREIGFAIEARMSIVGDDGWLDDAHMKYQGGDSTLVVDTPWPNASNLGSWIVTEAVDAMRARIMATVFTDPTWIVEGYGPAAQRAPIVEEFMQWKADQTKLAQYLGRAIHNSLIEGTGILEVSDRVVLRKQLKQINAQLQQDPETGTVVLGEDGNPMFVRDDNGDFVEAQQGDPHAVTIVSQVSRASAGPSYRVLNLKDFYILPGHASEREDVWGYAKRVWRRLAELQCRQDDGYYKNVDKLGGPASSERMSPTAGVGDVAQRAAEGQNIAPQQEEATSEKEIWELTLLLDLDDDGYEEWYVITYSFTYGQILRIQYENFDTPSYIILVPFPRPNSIYGFSYAKDKLGSVYDEHAALRDMFADRMVLKTSAPLLQIEGSPWNPADRPFGPNEVIPVRDMNEIKQLDIADVPQSVIAAIKEVIAAKERLSGMNDTTTGQLADASRTLGEVKLVTQQSWIRIDEVVKNLQQGIEDLFNILLTIWKNKVRVSPEPWPGDILVSMKDRAIDLGQAVTFDVLDGPFRGKPRGSVESSDFSQLRADIVQMITAITQLSQSVPALKQQLNNPQTIRSILTQIARVYRWPDKNNLVGNFTGVVPPPPPPEPEPPRVSVQLKGEIAPPLAQSLAEGQPPPPMAPPGAAIGTPGGPAPGAPLHIAPKGQPPVGVPGVANQPAQ